MDEQEFREFGKAAIDFVADYLENIRERQVLPSVEPGYLKELLPTEIPEKSESWQEIMADMNRVIMPGITHWQSPNFHAYYPTQTSYPAIVSEIISAGLGIVGFSWICSPACTELEVVVMDWLGKLLDLPKVFLNCSEGNGGGVIQGSASEAILVALLAARETTVRRVQVEHPDWTESDIRGKLIAYTSDHSNSCVEKSGILGAMEMRLIPGDDDCQLRGDALMQAIEEDIKRGKIPCICISTLGTTGTCAYDRLDELGPICNEYKVWLHIDAAYAGAAFCCPEYRHVMNGMEMADSFNFNLHKWMRVNFDCCAMWFKNAGHVTQAFNVDRIYLKHQFQGQSAAPDYRHWQIPLGRRFRALKVWITLRSYGAEKIRDFIRSHIGMAERFEKFLGTDSRFEVVQPAQMALVCFRLKGDCTKSKKLLEMITDRKNIYMIPATARGKFVIRYVVCGFDPKLSDVDFAWNEIRSQTDLLFGVTSIQPAIIASEIMHAKDKEVEKITRRFSSDVTTGAAEKNK